MYMPLGGTRPLAILINTQNPRGGGGGGGVKVTINNFHFL